MIEFKYKSEVTGKNGISARVVAKSKSAYSDTIITTWEYDAPKCILAELNTHNMLVKNAQSSRAVPVKKVIEQIRNNPVTPVHWGSNQAGMVAGDEIDSGVGIFNNYCHGFLTKEDAWLNWAQVNADFAEAFDKAGYHKQIVNRPMEAFTMVRGVITGTEIDNFFHLRYHKDADPYIQELARCMWEAYEQVEPEILPERAWHLPYVDTGWEMVEDENGYTEGEIYQTYKVNGVHVELEQALKVSAAACGQVSYRKLDLSEETVERVWERLMGGDIVHASVTGHQATPMKPYQGCFGFNENNDPDSVYPRAVVNDPFSRRSWQDGITHVDRDGNLWSAQFKHWIMHRKLIPNESFKGKFVPPTKEDKG